jgi:hypothetical protein
MLQWTSLSSESPEPANQCRIHVLPKYTLRALRKRGAYLPARPALFSKHEAEFSHGSGLAPEVVWKVNLHSSLENAGWIFVMAQRTERGRTSGSAQASSRSGWEILVKSKVQLQNVDT